MGGVLSDEPASRTPDLTGKLDEMSALLEKVIGRLNKVASAQQALRQHASLVAELRKAVADARSATKQ